MELLPRILSTILRWFCFRSWFILAGQHNQPEIYWRQLGINFKFKTTTTKQNNRVIHMPRRRSVDLINCKREVIKDSAIFKGGQQSHQLLRQSSIWVRPVLQCLAVLLRTASLLLTKLILWLLTNKHHRFLAKIGYWSQEKWTTISPRCFETRLPWNHSMCFQMTQKLYKKGKQIHWLDWNQFLV